MSTNTAMVPATSGAAVKLVSSSMHANPLASVITPSFVTDLPRWRAYALLSFCVERFNQCNQLYCPVRNRRRKRIGQVRWRSWCKLLVLLARSRLANYFFNFRKTVLSLLVVYFEKRLKNHLEEIIVKQFDFIVGHFDQARLESS